MPDPSTELDALIAEMEAASIGCWCAHMPASSAAVEHEAGCPYVGDLALRALRVAVERLREHHAGAVYEALNAKELLAVYEREDFGPILSALRGESE